MLPILLTSSFSKLLKKVMNFSRTMDRTPMPQDTCARTKAWDLLLGLGDTQRPPQHCRAGILVLEGLKEHRGLGCPAPRTAPPSLRRQHLAEDAKDRHRDPFGEHQLPARQGLPSLQRRRQERDRRGRILWWDGATLSSLDAEARLASTGDMLCQGSHFNPTPLPPLPARGQQLAVPQDSHSQAHPPRGTGCQCSQIQNACRYLS